MADSKQTAVTAEQGGMKKTLSLWNFFTIGFGAVIGTGWVLQVGDWMVVGRVECAHSGRRAAYTGRAALLAWARRSRGRY